MKRWQVVLMSAFLAVVALIFCGTIFYKYYLVPKYLEPVVEQVSELLKDDSVLNTLYDEAISLHEEGRLTDEAYSEFVRKYNARQDAGDEEKAQRILDEKEAQDFTSEDKTSATAKYASNRVGVQIVRENDGQAQGKSSTRYSTERTSDRIKAEDVVEAEKVIAAAEEEDKEADASSAESVGSSSDEKSESGDTTTEDEGKGSSSSSEEESADDVKSAYAILEEHMTTKEYATFVSTMNKLDIGTLRSLMKDKEGMKQYLHSCLSDSEYSEIVNLGYKYAYLFM